MLAFLHSMTSCRHLEDAKKIKETDQVVDIVKDMIPGNVASLEQTHVEVTKKYVVVFRWKNFLRVTAFIAAWKKHQKPPFFRLVF